MERPYRAHFSAARLCATQKEARLRRAALSRKVRKSRQRALDRAGCETVSDGGLDQVQRSKDRDSGGRECRAGEGADQESGAPAAGVSRGGHGLAPKLEL